MTEIEKIIVETTIENILQDIANNTDTPKIAVEKDFKAFNNAIDELIEQGLSEDAAILKVFNTWEVDFNR